MKVLVTGGFGYLGLALLHRLHDRHELTAFGHPPRAPAPIPPSVAQVQGDLADIEVGRFDAVIHLAGGGGPRKVAADPVRAVMTNVHATSGLLAKARAAGVGRLIFASTIQVYGGDLGRPFRESDRPSPDNLYGALKAAAEHAWSALGGGTSLRIANIYGAGCGVDMGIQGAVERFARAAARGGELMVHGDGSQRMDYVHVDDVAEAFRLVLEATDPPRLLNVGGGNPVSISMLAESCLSLGLELGARPTLVRAPSDGSPPADRSLAIELAAERLRWQPRVDLRDGLRELVRMMTP